MSFHIEVRMTARNTTFNTSILSKTTSLGIEVEYDMDEQDQEWVESVNAEWKTLAIRLACDDSEGENSDGCDLAVQVTKNVTAFQTRKTLFHVSCAQMKTFKQTIAGGWIPGCRQDD
ncbi:hypothetical protein F5887DRAFT_1085748 [Amanita rubescens]|nr:hypothetical protein F5887DRAFT_1085748 [Amanita rubescens]